MIFFFHIFWRFFFHINHINFIFLLSIWFGLIISSMALLWTEALIFDIVEVMDERFIHLSTFADEFLLLDLVFFFEFVGHPFLEIFLGIFLWDWAFGKWGFVAFGCFRNGLLFGLLHLFGLTLDYQFAPGLIFILLIWELWFVDNFGGPLDLSALLLFCDKSTFRVVRILGFHHFI